MGHNSALVLDPSADNPTPICLVLFTVRETPEKLERESYYFRLTQKGVLDRAFVLHGKRDASGKVIPGSGVPEPKDIGSKEIKDRLQHELDFWLKGMYRKPTDKPAAPTK